VTDTAGPGGQTSDDPAGAAAVWLAERIEQPLLLLRDGRVAWANAAAARLWAADSPAALAGRAWDGLLADGGTHGEGVFPTRAWLRREAGESVEAEIDAHPLPLPGGAGWVLLLRDPGEAAALRRQTLHTARLAIIGETVAALVHDLVQPLNVIRLGAEAAVLLADRGACEPAAARQQFEQIAGQCTLAAALIATLGRVCRYEESAPLPFDAVAAARDSALLLRGHLLGHRIDLDLSGLDDGDGPAVVVGRRTEFEQMVLALLLDADHALGRRRSGRGRLRLLARREDGQVRLEMRDNRPEGGAGAEAEAEGYATRAAAATVARALGGGVSFQSDADGGRVTIRLPLAPAEPGDGGAGATLLLVGDLAGRLAGDLAGWGVRVGRADPAEGWARFVADPADVVLLDAAAEGEAAALVARLRDFDPLLPILLVLAPGAVPPPVLTALADERCLLWSWPVPPAALREAVAGFLLPPPEEAEAEE
jgi:hypothetical protein